MTLTDILNSCEEKPSVILTIENNPVWDYKEGKDRGDILLISEDPWEGSELEYVSLAEIKAYADDLEVPYNEITFYTEADYEQLITNTWVQDTLVLSHY
jgi:hypothetical protein